MKSEKLAPPVNLIDILIEKFGHKEFRPGQEEIIRSIIDHKNVLAVLPTGAGKSLCYQLPALINPRLSIVISPLIALMKDQVDSLNERVAAAGFINSSMDNFETEQIFQQIAENKIKLLYVAPERLNTINFAERIKNFNPEYLFVDEAHCISEWGHNFRPSYRKIKEFIDFTGIKFVSAFTATATPEVVQDILAQLQFKDPHLYVRGFARSNLVISVIQSDNKRAKLLELMKQNPGIAIIYTSSRRSAEEVQEFLSLNTVKCKYYHAGLDPILRRHVQDDFISGKIPVIVATNAFGMGIDKKDIRSVIHYNMPGSIENYYQEIGRAGRDGKDSRAVLLYEKNDENIHRFFIASSYPQRELIRGLYSALCDFGQVALGNHSSAEIVISYDYLRAALKNNELNKALVQAALRILEEAGYMRLIPELSKKISFRFVISAHGLKEYMKNAKDQIKKHLLVVLLRSFGGRSFDERTYFSMPELAAELAIPEKQTEQLLLSLMQSGIIDFQRPALGSDAVQMLAPRIAAERLQIDFSKIDEIYLHAQKKLDRIIDYVYTGACRMKFVLDYFGEQSDQYRCGLCDNCSSALHISDDAVAYIEETILHSLYCAETKLSISNLVHIVRGTSKSEKFRVIPGFGALAHYQPAELTRVADSLINRHFLRFDFHQTSKLIVTNKTIEWLTKKNLITAKAEETSYEENLELFHLLRDARQTAAQKFGQSVFLICPDDVLRDIAVKKPDTKNALMLIPGFHERMFNKFGQEVLEIVDDFIEKRRSSVPLGDEDKTMPANLQDTARLLKEGRKLKDIAQLRGLSEAVISMQIETIIGYDETADISNVIPPELYALVKPVVDSGIRELKELRKRLDPKYTFPQIRIAIAKASVSAPSDASEPV